MPAGILEAFLIADFVLAFLFTVEMLVRIGAAGFYTAGEEAVAANDGYLGYINDPWNQVSAVLVRFVTRMVTVLEESSWPRCRLTS